MEVVSGDEKYIELRFKGESFESYPHEAMYYDEGPILRVSLETGRIHAISDQPRNDEDSRGLTSNILMETIREQIIPNIGWGFRNALSKPTGSWDNLN